jgi:succinate-semialdehyde dehydrogenase/glutarate-semialdehyde dehydrogenase
MDHKMSNYPELALLVGAQWRQSATTIPIVNPADEAVLGALPCATESDVDDAIAAAQAGLRAWRTTSVAARTAIILRAVALMRERCEQIARVIVLEQGKTLAQALGEVQRGCDIIEWDANEGRRMYGRIIPSEPQMQHMVHRQPIGVVAGFSPWNFPFSSPARKVGAALSAGCSLILKPAEETPGAAILMAQAFVDAGLPAGVLNLLFGEPAAISNRLIAHPAVRLVVFTGSVPVGKQLAALAGQFMKPVVMELGGHGPVIICKDANVSDAASQAVAAKSLNAGQACVSPTRFFVEAPLFDAFCEAFVQQARQLVLGGGSDPQATMGPLANGRRLAAISELVEDARQCGARVLTGGAPRGERGYFYPMTVLADVPPSARVLYEEPFGPIAIINRVETLDEAITQANALPFGLAAYAFTDSAATINRLTHEVEAGNLVVNHFAPSFPETPFGGVKDSGYGREGGAESLEAYTVSKTVSQRFTPA